MPVDPKYFRSPEDSKGYVQAAVGDDMMNVRVWWDKDDEGEPVIFQRLSVYPSEYLYIAIDWNHRAIVSTAFGTTDKAARRAILDDLNRRGWLFGSE